jgi:hypothetical protein
MKSIAQKLSVETWEAGPELRVVEQNETSGGQNGSKAKVPPPRSRRLRRPELAVLSWEIRSERLTKKSGRGKSQT